MRRIVFIDGEGLNYGLRHLLSEKGKLVERFTVNDFNYRELLEEIQIKLKSESAS